MKKVMIFGASGTIGKALIQVLHSDGRYDVYGSYHNNPLELPPGKSIKLSIEELDKLDEVLNTVKPDFVFLALRGDFDKQLQFHLRVAQHVKRNGSQMIFCSTTNVFDGATQSAHYENDEPAAVSDYGNFKIECEKQLQNILGDLVTIIRIPAVFGHNSPRIVALKEKLEKNEEIEVHTNFYTNSNSDIFLAKQINYIMNQRLTGIFHLGTTDMMAQSEFIKHVVQAWGYQNAQFKEQTFPEDTFFAVLPSRDTLPGYLQIDTFKLLEYLTLSESNDEI